MKWSQALAEAQQNPLLYQFKALELEKARVDEGADGKISYLLHGHRRRNGQSESAAASAVAGRGPGNAVSAEEAHKTCSSANSKTLKVEPVGINVQPATFLHVYEQRWNCFRPIIKRQGFLIGSAFCLKCDSNLQFERLQAD